MMKLAPGCFSGPLITIFFMAAMLARVTCHVINRLHHHRCHVITTLHYHHHITSLLHVHVMWSMRSIPDVMSISTHLCYFKHFGYVYHPNHRHGFLLHPLVMAQLLRASSSMDRFLKKLISTASGNNKASFMSGNFCDDGMSYYPERSPR